MDATDFDWRTQTTLAGTVSRVGQYVRGDCRCGAQDVLVYDDWSDLTLLCVDCSRVRPRDERQACDRCGARGNVWRDPIPRTNVYLCSLCHDPEAMFINRWANKVRESKSLGIRERITCAVAGITPCAGEVRWDSKERMSLCNKHRGKRSANEANN